MCEFNYDGKTCESDKPAKANKVTSEKVCSVCKHCKSHCPEHYGLNFAPEFMAIEILKGRALEMFP